MTMEAAVAAPGWDSERASLHDLYRLHADSLLRLATLVLVDVGDAEEVVQEAFVRSYVAWSRLEDPDKALSFLRSAVLNGARSRRRRAQLATRLRLRSTPGEPAEEGAMRRIQRAEMVSLLGRLASRQRECLVLRYYAGLSEKETADTLGVTVGSVKTHCHRGLARLAEIMGQD